MENHQTNYTNYQGMVQNVSASLSRMSTLCAQMDMPETAEMLNQHRQRLLNHTFSVGIMGEFKRGKSTVINSLLERPIMPANVRPATAIMNRVTYGLEPGATILMKDGTSKKIPVDDLENYVTKLTEENEARAAEVEEAVIYYPCPFCQNGVDIIDTPGLNDNERMNQIAEEVIPKLDAVIMVFVPNAPFSMSESDFIRNKLMSSDLSRLIFLVNRMDMLDEEDREPILEEIQVKIKKDVLGKTAEIYGEDSDEYRKAQEKIGKIVVYPLSARQALRGKQQHNMELIEESGTRVFEERLMRMLTEERGALELSAPLAALGRAAAEMTGAIEVRRQTLDMDAKEFEVRQKDALQKIEQLRADKKKKKEELKFSSFVLQSQLSEQVNVFYDELIDSLKQYVRTLPLDTSKLTSKSAVHETVTSFTEAIRKESEVSMLHFAERMESSVRKSLGEEADKLGQFAKGFSEEATKMQLKFVPNSNSDDFGDLLSSAGGVVADALTTYLPACMGSIPIVGVGGLVEGYKLNGAKGAALGAATGVVTGVATILALGSVGIVGLPLCFVAGAAASISGKAAVGQVFKGDITKKNTEKVFQELDAEIRMTVFEFRSRGELEQWLKERIQTGYEQLISVLENECEVVLAETKRTIDEIKKNLTSSELTRKQKLEEYDSTLAEIGEILSQMQPVGEEISRTLASLDAA
ncbi:MAG: dynamin family protein [Oscillibacter sp.]|nr:dynamin family protein [Oscillibacter sp.]